jgi:hypothetical protein
MLLITWIWTKRSKTGFSMALNDGLAYMLESHDFVNFQAMVEKALVLENIRGIMEHKRKMQRTGAQVMRTSTQAIHPHLHISRFLV